ncbi:MAG: YbgC/FadM family acyl-CoA thioesterase [Acetobacteraceae bacterium]|nr:YbgC/FadM family acyl-CoA thioesterase [Acetobacteraceae bacterium]
MTPHRYTKRVYYDDTDAGGIVYHANYLRFAEHARTEALREMDVPHAEMSAQHGLFFMVRRIKVDYLAPARLDDSLCVETTTLAVGAASVDLRQDVIRAADAVLLARLELQLVCGRLADQRPARIPPRWRDAMRRMAQP